MFTWLIWNLRSTQKPARGYFMIVYNHPQLEATKFISNMWVEKPNMSFLVVQGLRICLPASWVRIMLTWFCTRPQAEVFGQPFWTINSGLKSWLQGLCCAVPYEQVKLEEIPRKRLDLILLLRLYFYFPGIVNGLCWWLCVKAKWIKGLKLRRYCEEDFSGENHVT